VFCGRQLKRLAVGGWVKGGGQEFLRALKKDSNQVKVKKGKVEIR